MRRSGPSERLDSVAKVLQRLGPIRYLMLLVVSCGLLFEAPMLVGAPPGDWSYLRLGARLLAGAGRPCLKCSLPGGLHLYANYPQVQVGPLTLALARAFTGTSGLWCGVVVMTALGLVAVRLLELGAREAGRPEAYTLSVVLCGGVMTLLAWKSIAIDYGHLDDALVLAFLGLAVWAVVRRQPLALGAALGLAIGSKPTALLAVPLLLALPWRGAAKAAGLTFAFVAAVWSPFLLADSRTLSSAGSFIINVHKGSVLTLLGAHAGDPTPGWDRSLQLGIVLAFGVLLARIGGWEGIVVAGFAWRLLLDPGDFSYYAASVVAGALVWDLLRSRGAFPVATAIAFFAVYLVPTQLAASSRVGVGLRAAGCCYLVLMPLLAGTGWLRTRRERTAEAPPRRALDAAVRTASL